MQNIIKRSVSKQQQRIAWCLNIHIKQTKTIIMLIVLIKHLMTLQTDKCSNTSVSCILMFEPN